MKVQMYDPPSGWKYGFPKPYRPLPGENLVDTLVRDRYPMKEVEALGQHLFVRFFDTDAD